jgi:hypothetical protein
LVVVQNRVLDPRIISVHFRFWNVLVHLKISANLEPISFNLEKMITFFTNHFGVLHQLHQLFEALGAILGRLLAKYLNYQPLSDLLMCNCQILNQQLF